MRYKIPAGDWNATQKIGAWHGRPPEKTGRQPDFPAFSGRIISGEFI